mgnify:CR=1 FL=1
MFIPPRLIEVDLPIKAISAHARWEKSIRHGHISTLHIWWARQPLAACRAVLCAEQPFKARELGRLVQRSPRYLTEAYLSRLVRIGRLQRNGAANDPNVTYQAVDE